MIDAKEDFSTMLSGLGNLIELLNGSTAIPGMEWEVDGHTMLIKTFRHIESIGMLLQGVNTTINNRALPEYIDHSSISVLGRAAFENYLLYHFIFCTGPTEQKILRHRIWKMIGLQERQNIHGPVKEKVKWNNEMKSDNEEINRLKEKIENDKLFKELTEGERKKVLKNGDVKIGKPWTQLGEEAGFPRKMANDTYKMFCAYAHTGPASIFQLRDAIRGNRDRELGRSTMLFCNLLMSEIIVKYSETNEAIRAALDDDVITCRIVERWQKFMEHFSDLYNDQSI